MTGVRTLQSDSGIKPSLRMNVLRVIEEHVPIRLSEIDSELKGLQAQMDRLSEEAQKLRRVAEAAR